MKSTRYLQASGLAFAASLLIPLTPLRGADHGDSPVAANDQAADIADVYAFLDPNDFGRVVLSMTTRGFIVPSEAGNFGIFDPSVVYRFDLETNGDAVADGSVTITFSPRLLGTVPQTATIKVKYSAASPELTFTAKCTNPTLADVAATQVVTEDPNTGIRFFAGPVDDPFFFDIVGFNRFVASVLAGTPNTANFNRARDSFAGYNCMGMAVSLPKRKLRAANGILGVSGTTGRYRQELNAAGVVVPDLTSPLRQVDREGVPAVNVALVPFARKNEYNAATPADDAAGRFAGDIVATLTALGTNSENIGILASVAVSNGDMLRVNLNVPNTGPAGGTNPEAAFPNGRRLGDDVIDTLLFFITNQVTPQIRDNVNASDVPPRDTFPFFGLAQQPRVNGTIDDNTRN